MNVNLSTPVQIALRNLSDDDRRKVEVWIGYLEQWENDSFIQQRSKKLNGEGDVYMLVTNSDVRIFFQLEPACITVLDIAKRSTIVSSGQGSGAGPR
jgi:mRNA-degrading endonuclease RelE of RelBE toxin-antitoxin system